MLMLTFDSDLRYREEEVKLWRINEEKESALEADIFPL